MWGFADRTAAKQRATEKDRAGSRAEKEPLQMRDETESQKLSYEDMSIHYSPPAPNLSTPPESSPHQEVIQRKQTTPLLERFAEQRIRLDDLGPVIAKLVNAYDALANTADTKELQAIYLYRMLDTLRTNPPDNPENSRLQTALQILQDEWSFVRAQSHKTHSFPQTPPDEPWTHMDSSPFLRTVAAIAAEESQGSQENISSVEPVTDIPIPENFSAGEMIRALSAHHIRQLTAPDRIPKDENIFYETYSFIREKLVNEGMLSHYSHRQDLSVLHSTDYLKANQILEKEQVSKGTAVDASATVSKSQFVDTNIFRNTGFVFFFLERIGSSHRDLTGFGKYRYTVPLKENPAILNDAWAILHDMAGQSSPGRNIREQSPIQRIIVSPFTPDEVSDWFGHFKQNPSPFLTSLIKPPDELSMFPPTANPKIAQQDPDINLFGLLSLFLPTANQKIILKTPNQGFKDTGIEDHLSGNFLHGSAIIDGIALRAAHELMTLMNCGSEEGNILMGAEYGILMNDDNAFWEYISGLVHDLQVMIPHDVLPSQCDSQKADRISPPPTKKKVSNPRRISGQNPANKNILPASANNCFFDAMFSLMRNNPNIRIATANELRALFVQHQQSLGPNSLPLHEAVEYQHVQQFADIFHVSITVMAETPEQETVLIDFMPQGGSPVNHYYIQYRPPKSEDGIGHYTNL